MNTALFPSLLSPTNKNRSLSALTGLLVCLTVSWNDAPQGSPGSTPAPAGTVLNPPHHLATELEVGAYRSSSNARDRLHPAGLPYSGTHEVVNVDEISNATYELTDTFFKIEFNHIGNSERRRSFGGGFLTIQDGATTFTSVRFSVSVDTPYSIVGRYGASGLRQKYLTAKLTKASSTLAVFESSQQTQAGATAAQTFFVGGTDGTYSNVLQGDQTGILQAGELYTFWVFSGLDNQVSAPPARGTGSGSVTMYLGPVAAIHAPFGAGCAGSSGTPLLAASGTTQPQIGTTFVTEVSNIPMNSTTQLLVFGFSDTDWAGMALPASLNPIGLWNCTLYISAEIGVPMVKNGTTASYSLDIPNNINLLGLSYFNQALIQDSGAPNPQGLVVSNAHKVVIGGM